MDPLDDLQTLGIPPGSPPEALKPAWRRAVGALHPDRDPARDGRRLAEANAAYERLASYLRRHGRLPERRSIPRCLPVVVPARSQPRRSGRRTIAGVGLALAIAVVALPEAPGERPEPVLAVEAESFAPPPRPLGMHPDRIRIGSTREDVLRLAGRPTIDDGDLWLYGPSEIRFREDRVVEWHDSALRPLPIENPHTGRP